MTEEDNRPKITFDGEEYIYEELSDKAKYFATQLQTLNKDINDCQTLNHRLEVSRAGFIDLLRLELGKESEEVVEESEDE